MSVQPSKQFNQTNTEKIIGTIILVIILVVVWFLIPKKSTSKQQVKGWQEKGLTATVTLNDPNGNYLIPSPSRSAKLMTINLPKGSTGDRLRIANETSTKFSAFLGPESIMKYSHVINFGNKGDIICDNTGEIWQCNGGGVKNFSTGNVGDPISISGILWTIVNGGLSMLGGDLFGEACGAFGINFGSGDSGVDVQALITEFSSIVQSELNAQQITDIGNSYTVGAQQLALYVNVNKYQNAVMNREYADGGDPSILNATQRLALDSFITHFITDTVDGSLNKSITVLSNGQTGPDANGFYTWTLGNNWLLLTSLLTLYWTFCQEASFVDKDNKSGSNFYVPWRSQYIATLQDPSGPFVNGCKAAFAMWQDFRNRYMANITQQYIPQENGTTAFGAISVVRDNNTLVNGTCVPPAGPPPPWADTQASAPTTFVTGTIPYYYSNNLGASSCETSNALPTCVTAAWDASYLDGCCSNTLWTCPNTNPSPNPGPDPQLQWRANDLEYYYSNPTDTISGLLMAAGIVVTVDNNVITYSDARTPTTPSWWGVGRNVPKGTPYGNYGWTVDSPAWKMLCVQQCTKQGQNNTCSSGGPRVIDSEVTTNKCTDESTDPWSFGMSISVSAADKAIFNHSSTIDNSAVQSSTELGMPLNMYTTNGDSAGNSLFTCVTNEGDVNSTGFIGTASGPAAASRRIITGLTTGLTTNPATLFGNPLLESCAPSNFDSFSATVTAKSRTGGLTTFTFSSEAVTFWKYKNNPITIESDTYGSDSGTSSLTFNSAEWKDGTFTAKHATDAKYAVDDEVTVTIARVY